MALMALAMAVCGCRPTGASALLHGKKYLDRGDYDDAVTEFKTATTLLATNAAAWNYYGVALQYDGDPIKAANAYQRALELDRDFPEARLNLGSLWLDQHKPDDAKSVLTAFTLRWPNDPAGWLKLGAAHLQLGETVPAERCFSAVLTLKTNVAEAYNGLGLARIQRNRPAEAEKFFAAAVQMKPDFAAARLNLATVNHEYLHNDPAALENYRAWLALKPRPANWDAVNALVNELERAPLIAAVAPQPAPEPAPAPVRVEPKPEPRPAPAPVRVAAAEPPPRPARPEPVRVLQTPRTQTANPPRPAPAPIPAAPPEIVQVAAGPAIVTSPRPAAAQPTTAATTSAGQPAGKTSYWDRLFGSSGAENNSAAGPAPAIAAPPQVTPAPALPKPQPVTIIPPTLVNFPRYKYLSPSPPAAGDRQAASAAFARARQAEQNDDWAGALDSYRQAAYLDPSWFVAQYNAGVLAQRLKDYPQALKSYEMALAIPTAKPAEAADARYNFALALKSAGYVLDAEKELKKILAADPDSVRAHLALANLCAQQLHDPAQARAHYRRVLELDPRNSEASSIRFWLAGNPG